MKECAICGEAWQVSSKIRWEGWEEGSEGDVYQCKADV